MVLRGRRTLRLAAVTEAMVADGASLDIMIVTPPAPVGISIEFQGVSGVQARYKLEENPDGTVVDGSDIALFNRDRAQAEIPSVGAFLSPNITKAGMKVFEALTVTANELDTRVWILRPDTDYLIQGMNVSGAAGLIAIQINIDEERPEEDV